MVRRGGGAGGGGSELGDEGGGPVARKTRAESTMRGREHPRQLRRISSSTDLFVRWDWDSSSSSYLRGAARRSGNFGEA
ncbi:hypothetical protein ACP70R_044165 [Stipagrostis hirtigluma subsp. patula]